VPDGTADGQQSATEPALPPDQQVKLEISTGKVVEWLGGLFGTDWQTPTAGGGGTGGQFMFTNIAELDLVIAQWKSQRDAIQDDAAMIREAGGHIIAPAKDGMSGGMANTTKSSLRALYDHNQKMLQYANDYIHKLEASRASMVNTDQSGKSTMDSIEQG
jgi:hypothetical protein